MPYAAALFAGWIVYWLAFFPGVISDDSLSQWGQIVSGRYDDWHPVFHTWMLWLLTRPGHSLGTVSLVQVVLTAILLGLLLAEANRLGAPAWLSWSMVAWLVLSPVFGRNVIAVWKDNAFGLTVLWTALLLLRAVEHGRIVARQGIALGIALALMCLFRHNGQLVALPTLGAAAWYFWRSGRRAVMGGAMVGIGLVAAVLAVTRATHIPHAPPVLKEHCVIHQVAAMVSAGTFISERDRAVLEALAPLPAWRSNYRCDEVAGLLWMPGLREGMNLRRWQLLQVWLHLAARNPRTLLRHWTCVTRYLWSPRSELQIGPVENGQTVEPNPYGIVTTPLLPATHDRLAGLVAATLRPDSLPRFLVWQPALPLYVLLASLAVALHRARSTAPLLVLFPALCNTAVWLLMSIGPHLRFQWPVFLLAPLSVCLAAVDYRRVPVERAARG